MEITSSIDTCWSGNNSQAQDMSTSIKKWTRHTKMWGAPDASSERGAQLLFRQGRLTIRSTARPFNKSISIVTNEEE